MLQVNKEADMN